MKFILNLIFLLPVVGLSQIIADSTNLTVRLREVHEVKLAKAEIKKKAEEWIARSYDNSNYVTRINTEDNILTKGSFNVTAEFDAKGAPAINITSDVDYVLDLAFREGRYKIEIKDITILNNIPDYPITYESYFMAYPEWRRFWISYYEDYSGPGKKLGLNRLKDDEKSMEMYTTQLNYTSQLFGEIEFTLKSWNKALRDFMAQASEDDW